MTLHTDIPVGQIATEYPLATRVFSRHNIDFCCGGGAPLREACESRGLDPESILAEIQEVLEERESEGERWDEAPIPDLVQHILVTYHAPLQTELPRLEEMARKVVRVHGDKDPERLRALLETFLGLRWELEDHMTREEKMLFPTIVADGETAVVPLDPFIDDHTATGEALERLRALTNDYRVPEEACNTWRALWHGLEALEGSLHQHVHLENNVLFKRVTAV